MKPRIREMPIQAWGVREGCFVGVFAGGDGEWEVEGKGGALRIPILPGSVGVLGGSLDEEVVESGFIEASSLGKTGPGISPKGLGAVGSNSSLRADSGAYADSSCCCCHRTSSDSGGGI